MKSEISAHPPRIQEHHVRLPEQLAQVLRADQVQAQGFTGRSIRVAMIDSGFYAHPYYRERGYRITYVRTHKEKEPEVDEYGHGTAQLASLFAVAPEVEAIVVKCMDRDPSYALAKVLAYKPDVLSCAWGFNIDHAVPGSSGPLAVPRPYQRMWKLLLKAIDSGITVVAAGGNGQNAFPGSMPEVVAAGGIYYAPDLGFYPSDISSRFESSFFPGRSVPDLCGIVGNRPHGRLLLVPVPPKARLARRPGFATIAAGDSSATSAKGWAMFSGTSAATAMVAGAAALLLQKKPRLRPAAVKAALVGSARVIPKSGCRLLDVEALLRG